MIAPRAARETFTPAIMMLAMPRPHASSGRPSRRRFLSASAAAGFAAAAHSGCASLFFHGNRGRPAIASGVASGDVTADSAIIWSATDRGARMLVEWDTDESLASAKRVVGPDAVSRTGYTAKLDLKNLPPGRRIFYRVSFENLDDFAVSPPATGSFTTAPAADVDPANAKDVFFTWSGDTAGQGWGVDPSRGGMPIYNAIADLRPDFFLHSGDTIYADGVIKPQVKLADGSTWANLITPAKSKPAQELADFRGAFAYNLLAESVRRFNATVPMIAQWDDHEVHNNWYPGHRVDDPLYTIERDDDVLSARARQAFLEYMPIRPSPQDPQRIYRAYGHGPLLDVFLLDERSYRGRNSPNRQEKLDHAADFLGPLQLEWLKSALKRSTATWKVIASDMPISCISKDGKTDYEAWANGDHGRPLGRELELANLLSFIKSSGITNTVWITADVHYPSNIHYHPDRATGFKDFTPFWEFISGPLHAGGFGPNKLDTTFGPVARWQRPPKKGDGPGSGFAFFGGIRIDAKSKAMRVTQHGIDGKEVAVQEIAPA
jgi:alkaline phosphatase D